MNVVKKASPKEMYVEAAMYHWDKEKLQTSQAMLWQRVEVTLLYCEML